MLPFGTVNLKHRCQNFLKFRYGRQNDDFKPSESTQVKCCFAVKVAYILFKHYICVSYESLRTHKSCLQIKLNITDILNMKPQTLDLAIFKFVLITWKAQLGHLIRAKLPLSIKSNWNYITLEWELSWKFERSSFLSAWRRMKWDVASTCNL